MNEKRSFATITNLNPYGQHAWHVVAYHYVRAEEARTNKRKQDHCHVVAVDRPDNCSHVLLYLVELIDISLAYGDYVAASWFVDQLFDYRIRCTVGVQP